MPKDFIDQHLPIPFRISAWDNGDRILYQCPKCRASFQFFGDSEKYCHNCGIKIEWKFSPTFLDDDEKADYDSCRKNKTDEIAGFLCALYRKSKKRKEEGRGRL